MKALTFEEIDRPLEISNKPDLVEHPGQKLVMVKAAALNRRDYWITKGLYPGIQSGVTLGSDGAGICQGQDVVINPNVNWGQDPRLFDKTYSILGMPNDGTFAEYILVPEDRLVIKPHHLTYEQAAALPLGGLTAYRALFTKCNPRSGDKILISGVGGGVALFACQFAIAAGFETYVTSGSDEKIQQAISMGAAGGVNYKSEKWHNKLSEMTGGVDAVIDSAGGSGFNNLVKVCNPGARIAIYGGTCGSIDGLSPQLIFWKQIEIHGSTMGNDDEFNSMVKIVDQHEIVPVVDRVFDLQNGAQAIDYMSEGNHFGKIVLKINS